MNTIATYLQRTGFDAFKPKAVLFDMDGVLLDSMGNHAKAWHESMKTFGIDMSLHDAYMTEGQRGIDTIRQMVRTQRGEEISEQEAQRMYDEKAQLFHLMPTAPLMPGILQLMEQIRQAGMKICVVTGSGQRKLISRLTTDFSPYITEDMIVTAYDVSRGKPFPDPYLQGMARTATHPWQTIVVENAPLGVRAAVAAKAFTVAVNTGPLPDNVLSDEGADVLFHSIKELNENFGKIINQKL